jgi:diadenylate cyclase
MIDSFIANSGMYSVTWRDLLDILLMSVLIYQVGLLIKGTRALQTLVGVLLVVLAYWVTGPDRFLYLRSLHRVLFSVLFYAPFAIIILFQTTIRRALAHLGRTSFLRLADQELTDKMLDDIVRATVDLAARPTGALIVIEREQALPDQIESGSVLDAAISHDLLMNIFTPGSLLHDGAAIIGDGRVKAASCFLPVTTDPRLSREYGSRHRAAIGLTEEYDSVVIVASEERGEIRVAVEGQLYGPMDGSALKTFLRKNLGSARHAFPGESRRVRARTDAA